MRGKKEPRAGRIDRAIFTRTNLAGRVQPAAVPSPRFRVSPARHRRRVFISERAAFLHSCPFFFSLLSPSFSFFHGPAGSSRIFFAPRRPASSPFFSRRRELTDGPGARSLLLAPWKPGSITPLINGRPYRYFSFPGRPHPWPTRRQVARFSLPRRDAGTSGATCRSDRYRE